MTLIDQIVEILEDRKAENVVVLDLTKRSAFASHMIIATGNSTRQVHALFQHVYKFFKEQGIVAHVEGEAQAEWVLISAEDIVIHLFIPEARAHYQLEKMWGSTIP